jgi:subtilisin family serine protease
VRPLFPRLCVVALALVFVAALPASAGAASRSSLPWPLRAIGLDRILTAPAPASAPAATDSAPVVAIIDTGADLGHRYLRRALWTNPREIPGNGIDDDGNGHVDDVHGINLLAPGSPPHDDAGHGTAIAGIIAGRGRGRALRGAAPRAHLMIVKVLDARLAGDTTDVAAGVRYAVAQGADVINLSLAARGSDPDLHAALREARDAGVLVVAAAGNHGADLRREPVYPAAWRDVGAMMEESGRGRLVDLGAPGEEIATLDLRGRTQRFSGTSAAAPYVSGALATLLAATSSDADRVRVALLRSGRRRGLTRVLRHGAMDVRRAQARLR